MEHPGATIWLTGLPSSGKSTVACALAQALVAQGRRVEVLDGDAIRAELSPELGFSRAERELNVRRIGFVASLLTRHGVYALVAAISPYAEGRRRVRASIEHFVEVFVDCPLTECERRDSKGFYARARAGQMRAFTGVSDPYEAPLSPELTVHTQRESPNACAERILERLGELGYL